MLIYQSKEKSSHREVAGLVYKAAQALDCVRNLELAWNSLLCDHTARPLKTATGMLPLLLLLGFSVFEEHSHAELSNRAEAK